MKAKLLIFLNLWLTLCGCASSHFDWENDDVMLPEDFPFILRSEYIQQGSLQFWVISYDLNHDDEAELRVWYVYGSERYDSLRNVIVRTVYPHPYKVEFFDGRVLAWKAKIDDTLAGKTQLLLIDHNGKWQYKPRVQSMRAGLGPGGSQ